MQAQQAQKLIHDLQQQYPQAFKFNFIYYSHIKTKGVLDDRKEFIPWILALMIFPPIAYVIQEKLLSVFPNMALFDAVAYACLAISLFFMLLAPVLIKQIKHSSHSLYQLVQHSPIKIAVLIVLQALNFAFLQSLFVIGILFFFALSFGFVRFYKENMFREQSNSDQHYQLQQFRRICFWTYKQSLILRLQLRFKGKQRAQYVTLKKQLEDMAALHTQMLQLEHQFCKKIKYIDIDTYLDENL